MCGENLSYFPAQKVLICNNSTLSPQLEIDSRNQVKYIQKNSYWISYGAFQEKIPWYYAHLLLLLLLDNYSNHIPLKYSVISVIITIMTLMVCKRVKMMQRSKVCTGNIQECSTTVLMTQLRSYSRCCEKGDDGDVTQTILYREDESRLRNVLQDKERLHWCKLK